MISLRFAPSLALPAQTSALTVTVLYTATAPTLLALKKAAGLAQELSAKIRILVPQIVPYPLPLRYPPTDSALTNKRLQTIFEGAPVETHIEVFLCRTLAQCVQQALPPASLVLVGGRKCWWPSKEARLVKSLAVAGHHALLVTHP